jgi:WD40 repeat protein/serine/threonine protein kinase
MPEQENRTLTGDTGNTPQEDRTLTGGMSPASQDDQTLTGGTSPTPQERPLSKVTRPSARTLTHAIKGGTGELVDKVNWEVGDIIDGIYEVVSVIGRGGKGIVYKINHLEWQLELAVKMPLANLVSDETSKARFIREAQTWVDLGLHPNIVQCWYVRELGGIPRVFMDYIGGGSLKDWIKKGIVRPGEWDKILDMIIQACDGLNYAHEHGVEVHRDVKPGNMLLTKSGELLVTDFGIVKRGGGIEIEEEEVNQPSSLEGATITITGSELGTPEYGAPEQWGKAKQADTRADIYALGGVLFELCCGRRPFDERGHREPPHVLIGRHLSTPPPDPRKFNKDIPDDLAEIILRCLAKKPEERPNSMAVLRENLVKIYDNVVGKSYRRPVPQAVKLRSDALNNRAVSLLDLGGKNEAFEAWRDALKLDPYHPESIYNRALLEWRECKITDEDAVRQLEATTHAGGRGKLYLGFVHLERAAANEAEDVLLDASGEPELAENGILWRTLGDAQMAQDKYEKAEQAYQKTLELIPGDFGSLEGQTLAQVKTRQRDGQLIFPWHHCYCAFEGGHEFGVTAIVISPNGRLALSGSQDTTLRLWDLTARACLWTAKGHEDEVSAVALTPDERFAVSGSRDRTLRLWDLATGRHIRVFRGHTDWVTAVAVTPNGRFIVSGSRDHTLRLWNIATGKCVWASQKHRSWITAVAVTPDGRFILSAHDEENLYLWNIATGKRVERKYYGSSLEQLGFTSSSVSALTITLDGRFAVSGSQDRTVRLWDFKTGEVIRAYQGHDGNVTAVAVTPEGRFIVSGSDDQTLRLWDTETDKCLWISDPHEESITAVAMDPNGQFVISGSQDTTLRHIDIKTGKSPWTLWGKQGHQEGVTSVAMAPRGRFAVSGGKDTTLQLWDLRTARCLRTFKGHPKKVTAVAVTLDGQFAVSASQDTTLWLWDLVKTKRLRAFEGHKKTVTAVVTTPDGRFVISGSDDQTLRLWDLATAKCLRIFEGHQENITAVAVIPGERFMISASNDQTLRLWDLATAECLQIFEGHTASVTAVAVSPKGHFIVSGSDDRTLRLWDLTTAKSLQILKGHKDSVTAIVVPPNERFVISASRDKTLRLWDIETTRCLRTFTGHQKGVTSLTITPDGQFVVSGSDDSSLRLWRLELDAPPHEATIQVCRQKSHSEVQSSTQRFRQQIAWAQAALETGKTVTAYKYLTHARSIPGYERAPELLTLNATLSKTLPRKSLRGKWLLWTFKGHSAGITAVAITPNGRFAVSGSNDATLRMWDLITAKCTRIFKGHKKSITATVISPDGRFVVSGSEDTTLRLWDLTTAKCLRTYEGHKKSVTVTTMTQYGRFIVSGSKDSTLRVWNPSTTECLQTLKGHKQSITAIAVTPDKRFIVSGSEDKTLRLWDPTSAKCLQTLRGHKESVTTVEVTANGQFILSGSMDKTLRLWNISSGKCRRILRGHNDGVTSVVMTPDDRFAISGSKDKTLRLWNLITGECIWVFEQHKQAITSIAMTPDGRFIISGSDDNTMRQWELDWELDTKEATSPGAEEGTQSTSLVNRITSLFNK